ncbi:MAG: metallophosphoesterase family protein [Vicinamibacterales bacterium]
MRVAVISDIHANLTALEAVIADLRKTGADLIVHGGDLMAGGPRPAEVIDRIRELNWPGVYGNADEMLWMPHRVSEMLRDPQLHRIRDLVLTHTIPGTLSAIGDERLAWLRALPRRWSEGGVSVVHAWPDDVWPITPANASNQELERIYDVLQSKHVVYGHIHQPFARRLSTFTVANSGAVSLSYDGDRRAAYALIDSEHVQIRRVEYDFDEEIRLLLRTDDPFAESTAATLRTGRYIPVAAEES